MIHYDYYADVPDGAVGDLLTRARLVRLVTYDGRVPHIGLYPFTHDAGGFELHLHRKDEQIADLRSHGVCAIEVDEVLSTIPSHWVDPDNAVFATAYHRTAVFECDATLTDDAEAIAQQQTRIMARYQPEGGHRPVRDDAMYAGLLRMLVGVRLAVTATKVKFKLGQNRPFAVRAKLVERLRERGGEGDARTADALQSTIDLGWDTDGRRR